MKKILLLMLLAILPVASATIELDQITTEPNIIAAGDEVELFIDYRVQTSQDERLNDPEWQYKVELQADDDLTRQYVRITDRQGDDVYGTLRAGTYSKQFSIKIDEQATTGSYELAIQGQWYFQGEAQTSVETRRFSIDVLKEAIVLDVATLQSTPERIQAGDREVAIKISVANSGEKNAQAVTLQAQLPEQITPSYASSTRTYLGLIEAGGEQETTLYIDLDKTADAGEQEIKYKITYRDASQNQYTKLVTTPLYVSEKPIIQITQASMSAAAGSDGLLTIQLENTGQTTAEAIDVRLLKESNQPFTLDARSGYLGQLQPGESGEVVLEVQVDRQATQGEYSVPILARAKGDSEENDNTIYTYRADADITVQESNTNNWILIGIAMVILLAAIIGWRMKK